MGFNLFRPYLFDYMLGGRRQQFNIRNERPLFDITDNGTNKTKNILNDILDKTYHVARLRKNCK